MQYQNNPQRYLGTGGAGFTGSHLVDRLINPDKVTMYDNLSSGKKEFFERYVSNPNFHFTQADLLDFDTLNKATANHDVIFHLAGNPDVRRASQIPNSIYSEGYWLPIMSLKP